MFHLRRQLKRLKVYHLEDEGSSLDAQDGGEELVKGEVVEIEADGHPNKPKSGNQRIHAHFGWRHTHNKQLCVARDYYSDLYEGSMLHHY